MQEKIEKNVCFSCVYEKKQYLCSRDEIILHLINIKTNTIMAQTAMTVRVDKVMKKQFDALCEQFGMSANAAVNVFINAVVRTRAIPFKISAGISEEGQRLLDALYSPHPETPEMTMEEIDEEIRKARQERRERLEREKQVQQKEAA